MWIDEGSKYQTRLRKTWLQNSNIEMYLAHNEIIIINAKRYIRASTNKTYKYMAVIQKTIYTNALTIHTIQLIKACCF